MIQIGDYTLEYVTYPYRDPVDGKDKQETKLFINKPGGEGGSFDNVRLIAMLDRFWREEF